MVSSNTVGFKKNKEEFKITTDEEISTTFKINQGRKILWGNNLKLK